MATSLIDSIAAQPANATAVFEPSSGVGLTYGELLGCAERISRALASAGLDNRSRVGLLAPNGPEVITGFLGITTLGAAAAPINPALTARELDAACESLGLEALIVDPAEARPAVREICAQRAMPLYELQRAPDVSLSATGSATPAAEPQGDDVCLLLQTSGTTAKPKTVPIRQRNLVASALNIASFYDLSPADRTYCVMPLFHIHGLVGATLSTLVSGGTVIVPRRAVPSRFGADLREHGVTWVSAVPTMLARLMAALDGPAPPQLRFGRTSSSALPIDLIEEFESKTGVPLLEAYGMTEASHQMASNPLPPADRRPGSVGVASGTEIAILDEEWHELPAGAEGEVAVRGPGLVDGYLDNPSANAASFKGGWFRTGDLGTLSADGYLTLVGRIKELINRAGEKIAPREIDDVLLSHPAVAEAVAYAAPDVKYGEVVHAAVVCQNSIDPAALLEHCRASLAAFKVPTRLVVVDEIPKGPTGKVQRSKLALQLES
jgi:oxalate---CoA ligase